MKKQIKNGLLSLSLMIAISSHVQPSGNFQPQMADAEMANQVAQPGAQAQPVNPQMPSVSDVFSGMSEEEITKQVQEAQKLFESLTPEEMAEFEKVIEATLANMSEQDIQDIEGIAKMVEPHLDLPKENPKDTTEVKTKTPQEPAKKQKESDIVNTNTIQDLVDNIDKQINDILQKANSDRQLADEFTTKWSSKVTFDNLKRQILNLKQDRLAKKLIKKDNQEDKDLVEKLENFYKELAKKNNTFEIEDTFGLPAASKETQNKIMQQGKEILAFFEDTIDDTMPVLEKFLRKYDPEALEMAKEAEERAKRSKAQAQDATVRRGSAPVATGQQPTSGFTSPQGASQQNFGAPSYPSGYDQYAMPYGPDSGYDFPNFNSGQTSSPENASKNAKDTTEKKEDPKNIKNDNKENKAAFEEAFDELESHVTHYSDKAESQALDFINNNLSNYPRANDQSKIPNDKAQGDWIKSSDKFAKEGFKLYADTATTNMIALRKELEEAHESLDEVENKVSDMTEDQLKKISNSRPMQKIQNKAAKYKEAINNALTKINEQFQANIDMSSNPPGAIISEPKKQEYTQEHNSFVGQVQQNLLSKIGILEEKLEKVKSKIQTKIRRAKKKSKSSQAINK